MLIGVTNIGTFNVESCKVYRVTDIETLYVEPCHEYRNVVCLIVSRKSERSIWNRVTDIGLIQILAKLLFDCQTALM